MKRIFYVLMVITLALFLFACGEEDKTKSTPVDSTVAPTYNASNQTEAAADLDSGEKDLRIGILVNDFGDAHSPTIRLAMEKYARKLGDKLGYDILLDMQDAKGSMATQTEQATIMFASKPDFVIVNPADISTGEIILNLAKDHDISLIYYNTKLSDETIPDFTKSNELFLIATSPQEIGSMQGKILADLYKGDPSIDKNGDGILQYVMLQGDPDNPSSAALTTNAVDSAIANGIKLDRLGDTLICDWDYDKAQEELSSGLEEYKDQIEVVLSNNDDMALGAVEALKSIGSNTGLEGDPSIVVIGVDASEAAIESIKSGGMSATVQQDYDEIARASILVAINRFSGKEWTEGLDYTLAADGHSLQIPPILIIG